MLLWKLEEFSFLIFSDSSKRLRRCQSALPSSGERFPTFPSCTWPWVLSLGPESELHSSSAGMPCLQSTRGPRRPQPSGSGCLLTSNFWRNFYFPFYSLVVFFSLKSHFINTSTSSVDLLEDLLFFFMWSCTGFGCHLRSVHRGFVSLLPQSTPVSGLWR